MGQPEIQAWQSREWESKISEATLASHWTGGNSKPTLHSRQNLENWNRGLDAFSQGRYGRVERWVDVFWPWCRFVFVIFSFCIFGFDFFLLWFRSRQQTPVAVAHRSRGCRNSSLRCACSSLLLLQVKKKRKNGSANSICVSHLPFCFPKERQAAPLGIHKYCCSWQEECSLLNKLEIEDKKSEFQIARQRI